MLPISTLSACTQVDVCLIFLSPSDIDIVVFGNWRKPPLLTLARALNESGLPAKLQVIDKARVSLLLRAPVVYFICRHEVFRNTHFALLPLAYLEGRVLLSPLFLLYLTLTNAFPSLAYFLDDYCLFHCSCEKPCTAHNTLNHTRRCRSSSSATLSRKSMLTSLST